MVIPTCRLVDTLRTCGVASSGLTRQPRRTANQAPLRVASVRGSPLSSLSQSNCSFGLNLNGDRSPFAAGPRKSTVVIGCGRTIEDDPSVSETGDDADDQKVSRVRPKVPERDFTGTAYVPVYVMLPLNVIDMNCQLVDPQGLTKDMKILKSAGVDGVMVDCWWGIVEAEAPQAYNWSGYKELFKIVRDLNLKLQVVMSFHECGGNVGDDVCIPLPHWVGIDKERVLRGRTAVEVYFDYMRSFRVHFDEFFDEGVISMVEIGLGPCGELRYPSNPVKNGWRYPGIGEFQCYDQYLMRSLRKAAEARGHPFWSRVPDNCGSYNSQPHETGFFCDGGDYDGYHGRFFLNWYSQILVDHGDLVLSLSKLAFEGTCTAAKVRLPSIHWWYKTASHAAELTAGFYNSCNRDGYAAIVAMLKKHGATLNFCFSDLGVLNQQPMDFADGYVDSDGLFWQVLNAAWDVSIQIVSESVFPCHDRLAYNKILDNVKPLNDPDGRHPLSFTYHRLNSVLMDRYNFLEFQRFVKRIHGEAVVEMQV
ncbi:unnamed protein product [Linum tenue]|uniref:Beta-amylase n=1 Tax=Linum tenue TaxID=586396 RepID=A0AAV0PPG2_9ROSI|nr:unnamed protein product [Linum tenue]